MVKNVQSVLGLDFFESLENFCLEFLFINIIKTLYFLEKI